MILRLLPPRAQLCNRYCSNKQQQLCNYVHYVQVCPVTGYKTHTQPQMRDGLPAPSTNPAACNIVGVTRGTSAITSDSDGEHPADSVGEYMEV